MNIQERYESAKEIYAGLGVDVDAAVERLNHPPASSAGTAAQFSAL